MIKKTFGLKPPEEKLSEIEEKLGIFFLEKTEDFYSPHIGCCVNVAHGGNSTQGVYQGTDKNGMAIFLPVLIGEYQLNPKTQEFSEVYQYYWETERPAIVPVGAITGMKPITKEHIEDGLKRIILTRD